MTAPQQISYSINQAAVAFGVSRRKVERAIEKGQLPVRYWEGNTLIPADAARRFFDGLPSEKP